MLKLSHASLATKVHATWDEKEVKNSPAARTTACATFLKTCDLNGKCFKSRFSLKIKAFIDYSLPSFSYPSFSNKRMSPDMMTENFNQNVSNWSLDSGYNNDFSKWNYPIRVYNAKKNGALYVVLHMTKEDIEYLCTGIIQGFRVTLTFPGEVSRTTGSFYEALLSERTEIALKPKLIYARKELLHYTPNQRQCFFNLERKLRFFRMYSRMNCEAECLSNFTKIECDCVNFSMPSMNIF